MRVLAVLHLAPPHHNAGAELMVWPMLAALVGRGHDVSVQLTKHRPAYTGPYEYQGVRVVPVGAPDVLWRQCTGPQPPDLLITHLDSSVQASCVAQLTGIPLVQVMHNTHDASKANLARGTALAMFNTHWMAADYAAAGLTPRSMVLHPPIDPVAYRTTPGDRVTLVNLFENKGPGVFYALAERFPKLNFLGVIGGYQHQQVRTDLPNVEIIDHVPAHDMPRRVYGRTRILLAPSSYESYGRVVVEAACSGIPSIAAPTPGLQEALGPDGGTFCDRNDLDAWTAAVRRLSTPKGWEQASTRALAVADRLDTARDLARWVAAAEGVAGCVPAGVGVAG